MIPPILDPARLGGAWDPDYPTPSALAFKEGFERGALERNLSNIPDSVLSWAIDRAIAAQTTSIEAGRVFSDVYYRIQMRREPRGGYGSATAYLLAAYAKELEDLKR